MSSLRTRARRFCRESSDSACLTRGRAGEAPSSLIIKTGLPERIDAKWNSGRHEVAFYTQIAAAMSAHIVPRCFDAVWNADTNTWHLLLEDLTDSHFVLTDWPLPPTLAHSEQIIATRARFHAEWWDDPRLGVSIGTWLDPDDRQFQTFAKQVSRFADRVGDRLSSARRDFYQRLIDAGRHLNARYHSHRNMTLVQGDAHVWNFFCRATPTVTTFASSTGTAGASTWAPMTSPI
jgi:hypothetical protein